MYRVALIVQTLTLTAVLTAAVGNSRSTRIFAIRFQTRKCQGGTILFHRLFDVGDGIAFHCLFLHEAGFNGNRDWIFLHFGGVGVER